MDWQNTTSEELWSSLQEVGLVPSPTDISLIPILKVTQPT